VVKVEHTEVDRWRSQADLKMKIIK